MASLTERASQALRFDDLEGRYDSWLLAIAITLAAIGVVMVASSSMPYAMSSGLSPFYYLERHLIFLAGGVLLAVVLMHTELRRIEARGQTMLLLCFLMLMAVFVPGVGRTINGARRWISFGLANFQVVEAVKLLLIIWLATYLVRFRDEIGDSSEFLRRGHDQNAGRNTERCHWCQVPDRVIGQIGVDRRCDRMR